MPEFNIDEVTKELDEISDSFNVKVLEVAGKYFTNSEGIGVMVAPNGKVSFCIDIDKLK
ncbi:MAG TPA: hypothetical protein VHL77_00700 [Ferruginibacter sp.]|jgi:hypothetical protein|nr:hypothetical protein [Ferruginibacter sp.]